MLQPSDKIVWPRPERGSGLAVDAGRPRVVSPIEVTQDDVAVDALRGVSGAAAEMSQQIMSAFLF